MAGQYLADHIISFYEELDFPEKLPKGISWLYPQQSTEEMQLIRSFYKKYYQDNNSRTLIFGINPGRFGAGVTGINFTAPRQLKNECGIVHSLKDQSELSAEFIYEVIAAYGGPAKFFGEFFLGSMSPLGFVKEGKNLNYYDDPLLLKTVENYIFRHLEIQYEWPGVNQQKCICIGGEKNFRYLSRLNDDLHWFREIIPLPHPRFIQQYKRKEKATYIDIYLEALMHARQID